MIKVSLIIPYKNRIENLKLVMEALARQTMAKDEFEVVVGVMEYSKEYVDLCNQFNESINIVSIMINRTWQIAYARNAAINEAQGEVIVLLDADMLLGTSVLEDLYDKYFAYGQKQCIIGQMIGYDNNSVEVTKRQVKPFAYYEEKINKMMQLEDKRVDERFKVGYYLPWALAWTALIAIPRKVVLENELLFDLNFQGYGVEDLEWAYRICKAGIPLSLKEDVWGIHMPHIRNLRENKQAESINYKYFLKKWPSFEVELACRFGDFEANNQLKYLRQELRSITGNTKSSLYVVEAEEEGKAILLVGVIKDENGQFKNLKDKSLIIKKQLPLVGITLPYENCTFQVCYVLESIEKLSPIYRNSIEDEVTRIANVVIKK